MCVHRGAESCLGSSGRQGAAEEAAAVVKAPQLVPVLVHGRHRPEVAVQPLLHRYLRMATHIRTLNGNHYRLGCGGYRV